MNKLKSILLSIIGLIFLAGCANEYKTVEDWQETSNISDKSYGNIVLPENISIPEIDKLYSFDIKRQDVVSDENDNTDSIPVDIKNKISDILLILKDTDLSVDKINSYKQYYSDNYYRMTFSIDDEISQKSISYTEPCGYTWGDYSISGTDSVISDVECIHINRNETASEEYILNDKSYSIDEAKSYLDKLVEELKAYYDKEISYRAKTVIVSKLENGKIVYRFVYESVLDNIALSSNNNYIHARTGFSKPSFWYFEVDAPDHIRNWISFYQAELDIDSMQEYSSDGKYYDLDTATQILSDYLAPEHCYDVQEVSVQYVCITHVPENETLPLGKRYYPMWCYVLEEQKDAKNKFGNNILQNCAYVNMLTGEVFVVDDIEQRVFFDMTGLE